MAMDKRHTIIKEDDDKDNKKKKIMIIIIIIIIILSLISSCSCTSNFFGVIGNIFRNEGDYDIGDDDHDEVIKNKELKFIENKLDINLGDTKAKLSFYYKNIKPSEFTCTTSDADIASCYVEDDYVVINPYKAGKVTVYLRTKTNGKTYEASATVTINDSDRGIKLSETTGSINLAYEKNKNIAYTLDGISGKVTATSSDESIAKVTVENGVLKITAYKTGTVKITLNTNYNGKNYSAIYTLNVTNQIGTGTSGSNKPNGSGNSGSGNLVESDFDSDSSLVSLETNRGTLVQQSEFYYTIDDISWLTGKVSLQAVAKYGKLEYQYKMAGENDFTPVSNLKNLKLKTGINTVLITVTSKDGSNQSVYRVDITKETGNYIKKIESNDVNIDFDKKVQYYEVTTDKDKISFDVTESDKSQDIKYTYRGKPVDNLNDLVLLPGANIIEVIANHEDDEPRVYTIKVLKEQNGTVIDSSLSSLVDSFGKITDFNANKYDYYIPVKNSDTEFVLSAGAASKDSVVTIDYNGNKTSEKQNVSALIDNLSVGENYIVVTVNNNGQETSYNVIVDRAKEENQEGNNRLINLIVADGLNFSEPFDPSKLDYTIFAGTTRKLSLTAVTDSNLEVSYCYKDQCTRNEWTTSNTITLEDLDYGKNEVFIKVKEKNNPSALESTPYHITVIRDGNKEDSIAQADEIVINGTQVSVSAAAAGTAEVEISSEGTASVNVIPGYNGTVSYSVPDINQFLTDLKPGESTTITITVTSKDKSSHKDYTVKVTKKKEEKPPIIEETYKAEFKNVPTCTLGSECQITYVIYDKDGNEVTTSYDGSVTATISGNNVAIDTSNKGIIKLTPNTTSTATQELTLTLSTGHSIKTSIKFERPNYEFNVQSENGNIYSNVPGANTPNGTSSLIVYADIFDTRRIEDVVEENGVLKIYGDDSSNAYITVSENSDIVSLSYDKHNTDDSTYLPIKIEVNKDKLDEYLASNPNVIDPSFDIIVKGNLYGNEKTEKVTLKVSRNYTITINAGEGIFTENTNEDGTPDNVRIIPLQRGKSYDLSSVEIPYVLTGAAGENVCVKISKVFKQFLDENGNPISSIDNITGDRTISVEYEEKKDSTGNDDYPVKTFWLTLDGNDENGLFYTKEPERNSDTFFPTDPKYKEKLIYPGISGSYAMNITNTLDSKNTIIIKGLILEEQTICVEDGCVNMGYTVKSGSGNKPDLALEEGVTHFGDPSKSNDSEKYLLLNSVKPEDSTNSKLTIRNRTKDLQNHIGTNRVDIEFAENTNVNTTLEYKDYFQITLHWKWIEVNDKLDTAIGNIVSQMDPDNNIYSIKVGIQYIEICK